MNQEIIDILEKYDLQDFSLQQLECALMNILNFLNEHRELLEYISELQTTNSKQAEIIRHSYFTQQPCDWYAFFEVNPALTFEQLELLTPYWDDNEKLYCYFTSLDSESKTGIKVICSKPIYITSFTFDPSRYYRQKR